MKAQSKVNEGITTTVTSNKYLKPGALARLRNSKISARSHNLLLRRVNTLLSSLPSPPTMPIAQIDSSVSQIESVDQLPDFPSLIYGPRCIRRKKLVAAKSSVFFVNLSGAGPDSGHVSESSPGSPFVSVVNSDLLVH
ncbi:hypothetical protein Dimus_019145 [Dionaea muscipula]